VAHAQQPAIPVIGFFHLASLETNRENLAAFRRGLGDTGYIEGKNVAIEYRWAQGRNDRLVCIENFIRFDCVRESHNVGDYGCATLLLSRAVGLAVQVK
jgi:hypothetical protein